MSTENPSVEAADLPPLALIAGPTASGKSDLAVALGQLLETEGRRAVVINADSAQVYADLNVLSARPTTEEMGGIEHRLFGSWYGANPCSAADWALAAKAEIADAHRHDAVPILVGGTGLYMRTLLDGIAPVPPIDPAVREAVREMDTEDAWSALVREDPLRAAELAPADRSRISRALEVVRSTGKSLKDWQQDRTGGIGDAVDLHPLVLLPPRDELYRRCDHRFARMVANGALDEVATLLARGLDPALPVMRAIGVPELRAVLEGERPLDSAVAQGTQATRNYAKRQYTWFRRQVPDWPVATQIPPDAAGYFEILLHKKMLT